jgi:hypothetical protein
MHHVLDLLERINQLCVAILGSDDISAVDWLNVNGSWITFDRSKPREARGGTIREFLVPLCEAPGETRQHSVSFHKGERASFLMLPAYSIKHENGINSLGLTHISRSMIAYPVLGKRTFGASWDYGLG